MNASIKKLENDQALFTTLEITDGDIMISLDEINRLLDILKAIHVTNKNNTEYNVGVVVQKFINNEVNHYIINEL